MNAVKLINGMTQGLKDFDLMVYGQMTDAEIQLLERFADPDPKYVDGCITDYFGVKVDLRYFQQGRSAMGVKTLVPYPSDGYLAEAIEYVGLLRGFDDSSDEFVVVELGCGYGPWITLAAVLAERYGKSYRVCGVEGSKGHVDYCMEHLSMNGVDMAFVSVINGVISDHDGSMYFMDDTIAGNVWGAQATEERGDGQVEVRAMTIATALLDYQSVNVLHLDIQGMEFRALSASIESVNKRVVRMVIGTHSRIIEGQLFQLMKTHGWQLEYEKPCRFQYNKNLTYVQMAAVDGCQVWKNPSK